MKNAVAFALSALALSAPAAAAAAPLDPEQLHELVRAIDDHQRNGGDYRSLMYIERKEKDKVATVFEAVVFRRDADDKLMIVFAKPKSETGKGYLRIDENFWMYDPTTGKWERRTERERIGGTDSRRQDFDESRLAEEYEATYEAEEALGKYKVHRISLKVKDGVDVAYPVVKLWVDQETTNVLKRQDFALSGRLMRTTYFPKWQKLYSESKRGEVWYPQEMRFYDEVEKQNSSVIVMKSVDLRPLEANIFTKAWLESQSR